MNQAYFYYQRIVGYLKLKIFKYCATHDLLNSVSELATTSKEYASSRIWLLENVRVVGHSRFILKKKKAVYDYAHPDYHFEDIYTSYCFLEESQELILYHPQRRHCYFKNLTLHARLDGAWLSVMSGASENWMHWMAESIPRLAGVLAVMKDRNFGLLVDQKLPKNMREVLDIFAADIPRVEVRHRHVVEVSQLIVPTLPAGMCLAWPRPSHFDASSYISHQTANFRRNGIYHFDASGLRLSRKVILEYFDIQPHKARKLFILRKSYFRHMTNQERIEKLLFERGFESVSPGELSVEAQVKLFSEAAVVIAQGGAALANIMFMPEGSEVICIAVKNEYVNYSYFLDYAKIFGVSVNYVIGKVDDPSKYNTAHVGLISHPMNAEFSCSESELIGMLDRMQ